MHILVSSASTKQITNQHALPEKMITDDIDVTTDPSIQMATLVISDRVAEDVTSAVTMKIKELNVSSSKHTEIKNHLNRNCGAVKSIWSSEKPRLPDLTEIINEDDGEDFSETRY